MATNIFQRLEDLKDEVHTAIEELIGELDSLPAGSEDADGLDMTEILADTRKAKAHIEATVRRWRHLKGHSW